MHDEALTKEAQGLVPGLTQFRGWYLAGGTSLALQIGHRLSVDFDLFSEKELPPRFLESVKRVFPGASSAVTYDASDQLNVIINGIKTTFLRYPYPVIEPLVMYGGVSVASINEIAAMKAFSIGRRLAYKDYVDWYFLLKERHAMLDRVIDLAQKKYGREFNDRLFLGQLISVDDVQVQKIDFLRGDVEKAVIKEFLDGAVKEFTSRL